MPTNTFQTSRFENGSFTQERWHCGCGLLANWRTSNTDATKGEKCMSLCSILSRKVVNLRRLVLRCSQSRSEQCEFFLWEKDEAAARELKDPQHMPAPQTPTNRYHRGAQSLLTPNTRETISSSNRRVPQLPDMTPTPHRYNDDPFKSESDTDLTTAIMELLRSDNVELRTSTEVQLQHTIGLGVGVYEAKLRKFEETVAKLRKKLDELEGDRSNVGANP
jgi:hypothetical protein